MVDDVEIQATKMIKALLGQIMECKEIEAWWNLPLLHFQGKTAAQICGSGDVVLANELFLYIRRYIRMAG